MVNRSVVMARTVIMEDLCKDESSSYDLMMKLKKEKTNILKSEHIIIDKNKCRRYPLYEAFYYAFSRRSLEYRSEEKERWLMDIEGLGRVLKLFVEHIIPNDLGRAKIRASEKKVIFFKTVPEDFLETNFSSLGETVCVRDLERIKRFKSVKRRDYITFDELNLLNKYLKFTPLESGLPLLISGIAYDPIKPSNGMIKLTTEFYRMLP